MSSWYEKISIVVTAIVLLVVTIVSISSAFGKQPYKPSDPSSSTYSVYFLDEDMETLIEKVDVKKGEAASIDAPSKEATPYKTYTFSNWNLLDETDATETLLSVQKDLIVYATYTEQTRSYTITFYDSLDAKTPLIAPSVTAGGSFDPNSFTFDLPYDENYDLTFVGWVDENGNDLTEDDFKNILSDITAYAKYTKKTKTFSLSFSSPYIRVKEGDGTFITYELASQMKLFKDSVITIEKLVPEGASDVLYSVRGATVIDESAGTYRVYSNVTINASLVE